MFRDSAQHLTARTLTLGKLALHRIEISMVKFMLINYNFNFSLLRIASNSKFTAPQAKRERLWTKAPGWSPEKDQYLKLQFPVSVCDTSGCLDLSGGLSLEFVIINKALQWESEALKKEKVRLNVFHIKRSLLKSCFPTYFLGCESGCAGNYVWECNSQMTIPLGPALGK